jgi:hypothetical protein
MRFSDAQFASGDETMSELERVEAEYRSLATKVIYEGFEGKVDPADRQRLEDMADEVARLSSADFSCKEDSDWNAKGDSGWTEKDDTGWSESAGL